MSIEEALAERLRTLPPEKQQEVLDFAQFLHQRSARKRPLQSIKGLWANLGFDVTEEDIAQARREMQGKFPREDV